MSETIIIVYSPTQRCQSIGWHLCGNGIKDKDFYLPARYSQLPYCEQGSSQLMARIRFLEKRIYLRAFHSQL
nr:hypothetical protein [uncultured Prevotella sp.]